MSNNIIVNSDHAELEDLDLSGSFDDFDTDDLAAGLYFNDLDQEGKRKVRKELRKFKKGFSN